MNERKMAKAIKVRRKVKQKKMNQKKKINKKFLKKKYLITFKSNRT